MPDRAAVPPRFGGQASMALVDHKKPGRLACLGCQLRPAAHGQRKRAPRPGDHHARRTGTQRLLRRPQKLAIRGGAHRDDPACLVTRHRGEERLTVPGEFQPDRLPPQAGDVPQGKPDRPGAQNFVDARGFKDGQEGSRLASVRHGGENYT